MLAVPPVSETPGLLAFNLTLSTTLIPTLNEDENAIELLTAGGVRVLRYGELRAYDAAGQELPAHIELISSTLRLVIDDANAVYPILVDPLLTSPSWSAESNQTNAYFGYAVSTAGDVNGDGYSDVIVGAYNYDGGYAGEGKVFVYAGSAGGLSSAPMWTAESNQGSAYFGYAVGTAGDVNNDGYADIIVGAPYYDHGSTDEGMAFAWYGSASGLGSNGTPLNADWSAESDWGWARFGHAVGAAGDVDGDGYADVTVGAPYHSFELGKVYVYHGSASGLESDPTWTETGNQQNAHLGYAVGTAGDVDSDGYADVIVGEPHYDEGGETDLGQVYVYHGSTSGLESDPTWTATGDQENAYFGFSVSTAGDVDGNGYSDVIIGAYGYSNGHAGEGRVYVYSSTVGGLQSAPAWMAESNLAGAAFGYSVSAAGDVNGDGYADVIVGAHLYDNGQTDEGRAFAWYGSAEGLGSNGTPSNADWSAESNWAGARFGYSVGAAGDVNGDGYADVIVGAPYYDNGQTDEGRAYLYVGKAGGLQAAPAWTIQGEQAYAYLGAAVGAAGDVNGDGYADVIVGAPGNGEYNDNGQGKALVYYGSADGIDDEADWSAEGEADSEHFGAAVGTAGDVNGDGYSDVIIGAYGYDQNMGRAYVYYGSANGLVTSTVWTVVGERAGDYFGYAVGTAGDVNGDGFSDVIVGAYGYNSGKGQVLVYAGAASGLQPKPVWTAVGDQAYAYFGYAVGTAGDVNGDGYSDIIVGAPYYDDGQVSTDPGRVYVYHGPLKEGGEQYDVWTTTGSQAYARFGYAVGAAGDTNGDGYSDIIVGAPYHDNGQIDEGRAFVYRGSAGGLYSTAAWTAESNQAYASFGYAVSTAGDVNGDGYADVIVGAPYYDSDEANSNGRVYVYYGPLQSLGSPWTRGGGQANANYGIAVGAAGDVNGDGYAEAIIGAPLCDVEASDTGNAYLHYGNDGAGKAMRPRQMRTDSAAQVASLSASDSPNAIQLRLNGLMPLGREKVKLHWQVAPLGTAFAASSGVISGTTSWTDTLPSGLTFIQEVSGLTSDTPYHWRVRLLYRHNRLGQVASRWIHIPWNGWQEQDFRASAYTQRIISYTYDPLYRLTQADYSTGELFEYVYDSVGNRTRYTETITTTNIITYAYDAANRLTNVDGVAYTWDNNGNLLSDGSKTYTYTQANRLIAVSDQQSAFSFVYNGDGARVKQVADGHGITYTLDLAAPLVVVLAERSGTTTTHYLYSLGTRPLAQYGPHLSPPPAGEGDWAYLLSDALGSVRQLADAEGNVTLAQAYQPYGSLLERAGGGRSTFGYAGEQADESGLIYLRARYYSSGIGIFVSRDSWQGDWQRSLTLNGFLYVEGNVINLTDPSGLNPYCKKSIAECARDRRDEIIKQHAPNQVNILVQLFSDKELTDLWGSAAGSTAEARLAWFLQNVDGFTEPQLVGDQGFSSAFQDCKFYGMWKLLPEGCRQVGHFKLAVQYADQTAMLIGHEKVGDNLANGPYYIPPSWRIYVPGVGWRAWSDTERAIRELCLYPVQTLSPVLTPPAYFSLEWENDDGPLGAFAALVTPSDFALWNAAINHDKLGNIAQRDDLLWKILGFGPHVPFEGVDKDRQGNSLQDLRLSLKGARFAHWVKTMGSLPPDWAGGWLSDNLGPGAR